MPGEEEQDEEEGAGDVEKEIPGDLEQEDDQGGPAEGLTPHDLVNIIFCTDKIIN